MKKLLSILLLGGLILPLLAAGTALASDIFQDRIIFGEDFTLAAGQTVHGSLVVFGGDVTVEEGATITESLVVFGGDVRLAGQVDGDLVTFGGDAALESSAVVRGRLVATGGSISQEEGATVMGGQSEGFGRDYPFRPGPFFPFPALGGYRAADPIFYFLWQGLETLGSALALGLLALLVVAIWPQATNRVSGAVTSTPAVSGGVGVLTLIAVPVLLLLTAITICLIPLTLIGAVIYGIALTFGWLALGTLVGERLAGALNWRNLSPALAAGLGTVLFSLAASIIGLVPCLGFILQMALASVGLGAVVLTGFGTRPYLGAAGGGAAPPPPPQPVAPTVPGAPTVISAPPDEPQAPVPPAGSV